jgi:hypothetical protein
MSFHYYSSFASLTEWEWMVCCYSNETFFAFAEMINCYFLTGEAVRTAGEV